MKITRSKLFLFLSVFALASIAMTYAAIHNYRQKFDPDKFLNDADQYCSDDIEECINEIKNFGSKQNPSIFEPEGVSKHLSSIEILNKYEPFIGFGNARYNWELAEAYFREDRSKDALNHLKVSAEMGLPEARYRLANLYEMQNEILSQNTFEAFVWYRSVNYVFRESGKNHDYKDADKRAKRMLAELSKIEIVRANERLIELQELSLARGLEHGKKLQNYYENK